MMMRKTTVILRESRVSGIPKHLKFNLSGAAYRIARWSLSSGSPKARPDGG
jgi:hypothetical protein